MTTALEKARALVAGIHGTWRDQAEHLITNQAQDTLYEVTYALFRELDGVRPAESAGDKAAGDLAGEIRNEIDVYWHALDDAHQDRLEKVLASSDPLP